ncbi:oligogalacturonate-specific porin KdgM family protein [Vibrio maritimus]|uniref:oligogalacturonate-specific porin KdgM family protein n=1 Tax=Vibrio maritimus TaxID=990268 RepID=UPI001F3F2A86|nr:oligogalacturonate-specific porin KdgM family protein [Vibrio maritimus]
MKKLVALAIVATFGAHAGVYTDLSQKSNGDTSAKVGYAFENGISTSLEHVRKKGLSKSKETTLSGAWAVSITDGWYVKPQAEVKFDHGETVSIHQPKDFSFNTTINPTYKLGLETGYEFESGFYLAGRYRYETTNVSAKFDDIAGNRKESGDHNVKVHRTDFKFGYAMDAVDLSVNWVRKSTNEEVVLSGLGSVGIIDYTPNEFEFKTTLTDFGAVAPYAQYTYKPEYKINSVKLNPENEVKVGFVYSF